MNTKSRLLQLINMSPFHVVFIAQCVENEAKEILGHKEEFLKEHAHDIVSPQSWIECSEDAIKLLEDKPE